MLRGSRHHRRVEHNTRIPRWCEISKTRRKFCVESVTRLVDLSTPNPFALPSKLSVSPLSCLARKKRTFILFSVVTHACIIQQQQQPVVYLRRGTHVQLHTERLKGLKPHTAHTNVAPRARGANCSPSQREAELNGGTTQYCTGRLAVDGGSNGLRNIAARKTYKQQRRAITISNMGR